MKTYFHRTLWVYKHHQPYNYHKQLKVVEFLIVMRLQYYKSFYHHDVYLGRFQIEVEEKRHHCQQGLLLVRNSPCRSVDHEELSLRRLDKRFHLSQY